MIDSARTEGLDVTDCRDVPPPARALAAIGAGAAAVMITGSHIRTDRNGLKFYVPDGEITNTREAAILAALARFAGGGPRGDLTVDNRAGAAWVVRYVTAFGLAALEGCRIGLWSHSAVSRDLLWHALTGLGATVFAVWRSDSFILVDAEADSDWAR